MKTEQYSMTTIYEYGVRTSLFSSIDNLKDYLKNDTDDWNRDSDCHLYDSDGPNLSDFQLDSTLEGGINLFLSGEIDSLWAECVDKDFTFILTPVYTLD